MPKDRVCANGGVVSRRSLITSIPLVAGAVALPSSAPASDQTEILEVLSELEQIQGWEKAEIVAAKAYAAYRIREAMGLDLPDPKYARLHLDCQREAYEGYKRSFLYERDIAEGRVYPEPFSPSILI